MDLPTYTNIWRIEKRLYKLYDLRLPMPLPIVWIGVFVGVFVPWSLLLVLVGVPVEMPWHVLFLVPPGIVTWLSTRPVIEGKRLTELLESQLRYLGQPKAWYRLAPSSEPEAVTFSGRVWRTAPVRAKSKGPRKARHPQRRREGAAGPRQVRPAVAAAAAAAAQAPVAEPTTARTGWGTRRGTAPALKAQVRQAAAGAPGSGRRQERSLLGEAVGATAPVLGERELVIDHQPDSAPEPASRTSAAAPQNGTAGGGRERTADRRAAARAGRRSDDRLDERPGEHPDDQLGERPEAWDRPEPRNRFEVAGRPEAGDTRDRFETRDQPEARDRAAAQDRFEVRDRSGARGAMSAEALAAQEAADPIRTAESRKPAAGKPIDTEALRRLRRLAASADGPIDAKERAEAGPRPAGERPEDEVARDKHRKGQPPRLVPGLALSGGQGVWPPLDPDAKPVPRPSARKDETHEDLRADLPRGTTPRTPTDPRQEADVEATGTPAETPESRDVRPVRSLSEARDARLDRQASETREARPVREASDVGDARPLGERGDAEVAGETAGVPDQAAGQEPGTAGAHGPDAAAVNDATEAAAPGSEVPESKAARPKATRSRTPGPKPTRSKAAESEAAESEAAGSEAVKLEAPASEATGSEATGSEVAELQARESEVAGLEVRGSEGAGADGAGTGDAHTAADGSERHADDRSAPVAGQRTAPVSGDREAGRERVPAQEREDVREREASRERVTAREREAARERQAVREREAVAAAGREAAAAARGGGAARPSGEGSGEIGAVPVPRPGEGRVRRVESVVGRDSGGWRRIAQVVVGGGGVRTDGSEIDEARARGVFAGSRRVVVLGCTGGAGQSTTALMLGHAFAQYRDDRVVAVDASTGGGTLTSKIQPETPETLTSLLSGLDRVSGYLTMRGYTTRTASGLEVISADSDAGAEQRLADRSFFSDHRLGESMRLLDRHYKLAVIDPAAALAARLLPYADQLVLVVPASEEAPEAVAMTYEWLDGHGCAELRRRAVMVVNGVSRRSMTDVEQAEAVARGRCRAIVRVPWEDGLAPGGAEVVDPGQLRAAGRRAYLALAGVVVAGFAAQSVRPSEEELASDPPGTRIGER
ncbi:TcpE family conjugal transfer membrane protein [Nonomuraea fuscirosea]|uniref:TcpE family conjugal transfer membrane protein n=1 Tax=Nonomuraea fuscirosea TaxID=1291556 RepID=UPI002DD877CC|nr:TcpE family conjugal transfer membrane protein [Nonomuraea fuscirosea]WSA52924.1 TcpE family conjugal transfer membrane protein [Nonomuraea fuscirosea]